MDSSIFRFVLRHTKKDQLLILLLTLFSFPFVYYSLEVPKLIINNAIGGVNVPTELFGWPMDQVRYLFVLCGLFLGLVLVNGAIKYVLNVYRGVLGERMLRRLRYELYCRVLRFPLPRFKHLSQGEVIPVIIAETERIGGFVGEAFALPAFQGGMLLTYLFFIFNQDPMLGLAATALYPFQLYLIPKLQRRINALNKKRILEVRKFSDRIGESIAGIREIHVNDTSHFERAKASSRLGAIFEIRFEIYKKKFFIKFINNFLAQITPFFFYSAGGYYVIQGELSLGAMVAVLAAYKDLNAPWKELLKYYETKEDVRIKYDQVLEMFQVEGMLDPGLQDLPELSLDLDKGGWQFNRVGYENDESGSRLERLSVQLDPRQHTMIVGYEGSGREELGELLVRLLTPTRGSLTFAGADMSRLPESSIGLHLAYVSAGIHLFSGTIRDNLLYPLRRRMQPEDALTEGQQQRRNKRLRYAQQSGNSEDDPEGTWIDFKRLGLEDAEALRQRIDEAITSADLELELFQLGLSGQLKEDCCSDLVGKVLEARCLIQQQLSEAEFEGLVEPLEWQHYNSNLTVFENILFGSTPGKVNIEDESSSPIALDFLREMGLFEDFVVMGRKLTEIMVDLFSDVDEHSDLFDRFSFIRAEDLPAYRKLLKKTAANKLDFSDKVSCSKFIALTFRLCPAQHRLGLVDVTMQQRIVQARFALAKRISADPSPALEINFFDVTRFDHGLSLLDNMLFGRLVYGKALAKERVTELIYRVVDELGLGQDVRHVGLEFEVGTSGSRMSLAQRQKLAVARALIKQPDVLILSDALSGLDPDAERRLLDNIFRAQQGRGLVMLTARADLAPGFDRVLTLKHGQLQESGD
ncbi:MAG: putative ABC transport system ATP-binding protein [Motiliproteus sp.]|jgi:putative ABC transport system ATP-binding protein